MQVNQVESRILFCLILAAVLGDRLYPCCLCLPVLLSSVSPLQLQFSVNLHSLVFDVLGRVQKRQITLRAPRWLDCKCLPVGCFGLGSLIRR